MTIEKIKKYLSQCSSYVEINEVLRKIKDPQEVIDDNGNSLLHWSVIWGNYILSKTLIDKGIDINKKNNLGCCALELSIQYKEKKIIDLLLANKAILFNRNGFTALHAASASGNIKLFDRILPFYKRIDSKDYYGRTPLHWAVEQNNYNITLKLIGRGANLNSRDDNGFTPLYYSVTEGYNKLFDLLISNGGNYKRKYQSNTLLHIACAWDRISIVQKLTKLDFNINALNKEGNTPLHFAYMYNYNTLIKFLIKNGAKVNKRNKEGLTPSEIVQD